MVLVIQKYITPMQVILQLAIQLEGLPQEAIPGEPISREVIFRELIIQDVLP